ncbi:hypothetical protein BASA50_000397 [Batrachochytrium salamandrivorans]|uniref:Uncharacterized protein n=1 Tax=Batrachochytrium salamandrivorans TaxID=1357716 RepID=A0ABQ8EWR0_9FUNG|nr:hypothetical protein BASA50_000397 [Batrachochytrium salamandrivorans]KAH6597073.1 hypothetical protein BASA61_003266 [Batrachochytrium salamandrivorans]
MKLISFAVISLLAITVSADSPPSTSTVKYALQSDQDLIQEKLQDLTTAYQIQEDLALKLGGLEELEKEERETKLIVEGLKNGFKRQTLSRAGKLSLEKQYADAVKSWKEAESALMTKKDDLKQAREKRNDMVAKLYILKENLERQTEQDANAHNQGGTSPDSSSPRRIMEKQVGEAFQEVDDLLNANDSIMSGIYRLGNVIKRAKDPKKVRLIQPWEKLYYPRKRLLRELYFSKCQSMQTRVLQAGFGWQSLSSWIGGELRASWQEVKLHEIFVGEE